MLVCKKILLLKKTFLVLSFFAFGFSYAKANPDHSKMDHSKSDHAKMDHSKMDHSKSGHTEMDHSKMDHGMDHSTKDQSNKNHSMDHSEKSQPKTNQGGNNDSEKTNRQTLTEAVQKSIISVLSANTALHNAFFNYNGKLVEEKALELQKAIEAIQDEEISKLLNFSKSKLSEIKAENSRKTNNKNYHLVSMALIHIINKYDVGPKYNAYSCPMVRKKWIQNSETMPKVHNPYSPKMPHCGSQDSHY